MTAPPAAPPAAPVVEPVAVPREPTLLMENAGYRVPLTGHHIPHRYFGAVWRAMYDAASPAAPVVEPPAPADAATDAETIDLLQRSPGLINGTAANTMERLVARAEADERKLAAAMRVVEAARELMRFYRVVFSNFEQPRTVEQHEANDRMAAADAARCAAEAALRAALAAMEK